MIVGAVTGCLVLAVVAVVKRIERYLPLCVPDTPALARVSPGELHELRAGLNGVMAQAGRYVYSDDVVIRGLPGQERRVRDWAYIINMLTVAQAADRVGRNPETIDR